MTPLSAVILTDLTGEASGDRQNGDMPPIEPGVSKPSLLCQREDSETEW